MTESNYLFDEIFKSNETSPNIFLINENKEITYLEFNEIVNQISNYLIDINLLPGDRVAIQAEKNVIQLATYVATIKAGGVYLPLNTGYTLSELEYFFNDAKPKVIIVDDKIQNKVKNLVSYSSVSILSLNLDETGSLIEQIKKYPKKFQSIKRNENDLAAILYTSGTTGKSKGAMLSHRNLVSNSEVLRNFWKFTENDVLLHMLPIYHTHGLFVACNLLAIVGGSMIFLEKFDVEKALLWMKRATSMMGVPTFYTRLLASEKLNNESAKHMRLFISGSAPLLSETHIEFEKRTGKKILERYGMTETNMNISNPYYGLRKAGTVGISLPGIEIRIVNEEGKEVEVGQIGTIELKGENIFKGYWGMEEKTKESFKDDGFFITGDLAKKDENGYFTIVGRDKDMIISGGLNVYPKEIEDVINQIPDISESAVIGINHYDFGEAVVALVISDNKKLEINKLTVTIIILPITNIGAFYSSTPYVNPIDNLNINRIFPGNKNGSVSEKIAHFIATKIIPVSDIFLDAHSGDANEDLLPFVFLHNV